MTRLALDKLPLAAVLGGGWEHGDQREIIAASWARGGSGQGPRGAGVRSGELVSCGCQSEDS